MADSDFIQIIDDAKDLLVRLIGFAIFGFGVSLIPTLSLNLPASCASDDSDIEWMHWTCITSAYAMLLAFIILRPLRAQIIHTYGEKEVDSQIKLPSVINKLFKILTFSTEVISAFAIASLVAFLFFTSQYKYKKFHCYSDLEAMSILALMIALGFIGLIGLIFRYKKIFHDFS